jgi:hypothetical protein
MKARFALAVPLALSLSAAAGIVIEELPGTVSLEQAVRLSDGHVLPAAAAPYGVQIHYQGFGNTAEIWFFTGGVFKGKTNAEARGFPAGPPPAQGDSALNASKDASKIVDPSAKLDSADQSTAKVFPKVEAPDAKVDKKYIKMSPAGASQTFSWGARGFQKGLTGKAVPYGRGFVKLSFDSANSAAGFSALLPAVQR